MGEVIATAFGPCGHRLPLIFGRGVRFFQRQNQIGMATGRTNLAQSLSCTPPAVRQKNATRAHSDAHVDGGNPPAGVSTFSSSVSTEIPVYEPPGVSLDDYISDRPRVFRAMFPDQSRSNRLNDEEWRIQMLPLRFLFLSTSPMIVMRLTCKSGGDGYPPAVPDHATSVLELRATRWELQGLEGRCLPPHFALGVRGFLYPDREGSRSRLRGHLELSVSLLLPPLLALVPDDVLKGGMESILDGLVGQMKKQVNGSLLSDYGAFRREKLMAQRLGTISERQGHS